MPTTARNPTSRRRLLLGASAGAAALAVAARFQRSNHAGRVLEERETPFGRLAVIERDGKRYLAYGDQREIVYQSVIDLARPLELAAPYMQLMMLALAHAARIDRVLQIGVGAGNMAGYLLRHYPQPVIDAVDIDRHAVELGARWFGLTPQPRLAVHIDDGRRWLQASRERFDIVMLDAYDDRSIPAALAEASFFALAAERLAEGGVAAQNVYRPIVDAAALVAAMRPSFSWIEGYAYGDSLVLMAGRGDAPSAAALAARARAIDQNHPAPHPLAGLLSRRTTVA